MRVLVNSFGLPRNFDDHEVVTKIIEAKKEKKPWDVIDMVLDLWQKKFPQEYNESLETIGNYKEETLDKDFAQTKGGKQYDRRFLLSFPPRLMRMIRTVYEPDEFPIDQKFFQKFAKRYPKFRIGNKI